MSFMPTSPSKAVTVLEMRSRKTSRLLAQSRSGAASEESTLTGIPESEPGV